MEKQVNPIYMLIAERAPKLLCWRLKHLAPRGAHHFAPGTYNTAFNAVPIADRSKIRYDLSAFNFERMFNAYVTAGQELDRLGHVCHELANASGSDIKSYVAWPLVDSAVGQRINGGVDDDSDHQIVQRVFEITSQFAQARIDIDRLLDSLGVPTIFHCHVIRQHAFAVQEAYRDAQGVSRGRMA